MSNYNGDIPIKSTFLVELSTVGTAQTLSNAFGPDQLTSGSTKFRVTSTLNTSADEKVFAICKGNVLVVPQIGSSTLVNLVLKPYKQPSSRLPIRYFIYRGVKKSSIIDGTPATGGGDQLIQHGSLSGKPTMVNNIWTNPKNRQTRFIKK